MDVRVKVREEVIQKDKRGWIQVTQSPQGSSYLISPDGFLTLFYRSDSGFEARKLITPMSNVISIDTEDKK